MAAILNLSRRHFLKGAAGTGGFVLGLQLAPATRLPLAGQELATAVVTAGLELGLWAPTRLLGRLPAGRPWVERLPLSHACRFSFRAKMASVFDRLNPPLTHFHTKPELEDWCRRARLTDWQVVNRDGRGWLVWGRPA